MATTSRLRFRRSAAQMHALVEVEREIRSCDQHSRRKYLREFSYAYQRYERVLSRAELDQALLSTGILLVGDYHALAASQRFTANVVQKIAASGMPVVLGLETVFSRDQHILDEWQDGEIDAAELRERIRFDLDWGYDWNSFYQLLEAAKVMNARIYGLDCVPRGDLRRIAARDRHAAEKIAEIRATRPDAAIVVLFGESHLAPQHLPELIRERLPQEPMLTVLQNVDPLYWQAAGEAAERVEAVRVNNDTVCVFTSTPLEKYESYRLCIERWRRERQGTPDLAPQFYNLVDALLRFLNIDKYSTVAGEKQKLLVDLLPEIVYKSSEETLRKTLLRKRATEEETRRVLLQVERFSCSYLPRLNTIFVRTFQMPYSAEAATQFLHAACSGALGRSDATLPSAIDGQPADDDFYARCIEAALGYFGSRVLSPGRASEREQDLYSLYSHGEQEVETQWPFSYRDFMRMIDLIVMHRDYESNARKYWQTPWLIEEGRAYSGARLDFVTGKLGAMLGSDLYDAYVAGRVHKRFLRSLFFRDLRRPGAAHTLYFAMARRSRRLKRRLVA